MNWTEQVWTASEHIYEAITKMPFIKELKDGTLPLKKFLFYLSQDSLYLREYSKVLSMAGAKAYHIQDAKAYYEFALVAVADEGDMQANFFRKYGKVDPGIIYPACHHYTSYLKATAAFEPVEVAMAASLPCFWIYMKIGEDLLSEGVAEDNPYKSWIDLYGGEDFKKAVEKNLAICNRMAEETTADIRERMMQAYLYSAHFEYEFWEAGYIERRWKLSTELQKAEV